MMLGRVHQEFIGMGSVRLEQRKSRPEGRLSIA